MAMPFTHTGVNTRADGRQRLLDAAVRWLETASEADFRMLAIAAEADVTIALITHHFGSRDGNHGRAASACGRLGPAGHSIHERGVGRASNCRDLP